MSHPEFFKKIKSVYRMVVVFSVLIIIIGTSLLYKVYNPSFLILNKDIDKSEYSNIDQLGSVQGGIHTETGFKNDPHLPLVITSCTPCHSAKLVTQNRATKEGWISIIRWMQETQNLWDLGPNEDLIVAYLAKHYGPEDKGRREALTHIEWYDLED